MCPVVLLQLLPSGRHAALYLLHDAQVWTQGLNINSRAESIWLPDNQANQRQGLPIGAKS